MKREKRWACSLEDCTLTHFQEPPCPCSREDCPLRERNDKDTEEAMRAHAENAPDKASTSKELDRDACLMTVRHMLGDIEFANSGHRHVAIKRLTECLLSFVERIQELERGTKKTAEEMRRLGESLETLSDCPNMLDDDEEG